MKAVKLLHQQSMDLAESATLKQQQEQVEEARDLWQQAFELETQAAALLANEWNAEPTRSVLHRSAATLALRCDQVTAAERLPGHIADGKPARGNCCGATGFVCAD